MRINIIVPDATSAAFTSKVELANMPLPLIRLAPSNELVMIELQGSLDIDDPDAKGGQTMADLEFHHGREDRPTLLISHHRLEGKLVTLVKPFAVLERKKRTEDGVMRDRDMNRQPEQDRLDMPPPSTTSSPPTTGLSQSHEEPGSPSPLARKRGRPQEGNALAAASSSPIAPRRLPGSEADFSSPMPSSKRARQSNTFGGRPDGVDVDADAGQMDKEETATYMEVVCIIRKKLLFSKRPEPIVRLDQAGGEKAKQALGITEKGP